MVRLKEGDDLALNGLMEWWQKPLHSFILRYVGNHRDSIELAEETFVSSKNLFLSAEEIPSALASRTELARLVKEEIEKLPHDLKTAVLLFAYDNLSYAETAKILGCTPKAVETRLYRVRKLLAKRLAAFL
jgi:RNA polymerase sigma factor (sigma-70 family)